MPQPTLYLIDGYAQFFRAYHAIRTPMTSPVTKEPTNLTFGFTGMLLKLLRGGGKMEGPPDYVVVALDISGDKETFRSLIDPEYKANRPPPPEDLFPQVERCIKTLHAMGIPTIGVEGFEADDAIATLVTRLRLERPDLRIRIVSKDKDLKQLLTTPQESPPVEMYDVHTDLLIDSRELKAETGLEPKQVIDMLALMGDTVDNVKGVEGVGPKTAAELIGQYGSLTNLLTHASEVKGKRGEALRAAAPRLPMNIELVSLRHDVPLDFNLSQADVKQFQLANLAPILRELGFNRYQDELKSLMGEPTSSTTQPPQAEATPAARSKAVSDAPPEGGLFSASLFESSAPSSSPARPANPNYHCITTKKQLAALIDELIAAPIFAIDTETTGLSPLLCDLCGLSVSTKSGTGYYIPVRSPNPREHLDQATVLDMLRPLLEDQAKPKCGHNIKFDLLVLRAQGVQLRGISSLNQSENSPTSAAVHGFDSMVASYLIDSARSSHSMDALALALLNHTNISIKELIGSGTNQRTFDTVPLELATQYAAEDADITFRLREAMLPQLQGMGLMTLFDDLEMPLVEVLAELEFNGILVDPAELDRQRERLLAQIAELKRKIDDESFATLGRTFNLDSPKQLAVALFNPPDAAEPGLGIKSVKKTKTGHSTDIEVLEKLTQDATVKTPIPALIVDYRQLTKLVSTYLLALKEAINPRTHRIHASFNQTVAATGRLSSSDPNLQNIPIRTEVGREIRRAFIAPPNRVLISADYSQIELRILAHLSRDPALIEAFQQDQDIHAAVAAQINNVPLDKVTKEQRSGAKMVNFGIVYGVTPYGLARRLGIGNDEAAAIIDAYKKKFAGITTFLQECIDQAQRNGYVETMLKRRRAILDIDSTNPSRRALAERVAINSVVQGSAADLIKLAMIDLEKLIEAVDQSPSPSPNQSTKRKRVSERPPSNEPSMFTQSASPTSSPLRGVKMLLQIHDELVFEGPADSAAAAKQLIVDRMEKAMTLSVPLRVDGSIATNWFEGK